MEIVYYPSDHHIPHAHAHAHTHTQSGAFMVEARVVSKDSSGREIFPLVDTDFAFAWVDFHYPMGPQFRDILRDTCRTAVCRCSGHCYVCIESMDIKEDVALWSP